MLRFLIVVALVVKLLLLVWLAGLWPCPADQSELWSRAQHAFEVLRGSEEDASDAQQWQRIPHDEAVFGGGGMMSVTIGGPGLVAVGGAADTNSAAVMTSPDGLVWQRVVHDEAVFGGDGWQTMQSVTEGGPGLVAVGYDWGLDAAAVWTSTDGTSWQRITHDEAVFGGDGEQRMLAVTAGGPGLVAVGHDWGLDAAAVWTSTDGSSWQRIAHDEAVFEGGTMESVTVGGPGLVAVGGYVDSVAEPVAAVWTSTDGSSWQRVAHDEAVFGGSRQMQAVTPGGSGLVAVGHQGYSAAAWTSVDGVNWQQAELDDAAARGLMMSVTSGGPGLVAVGFDLLPSGVSAVWTSTNGLAWQRVEHDEGAFGSGTVATFAQQGMMDVTVGRLGLVAVGYDSDGHRAAIWTSQ